jgi:hypothetical protein
MYLLPQLEGLEQGPASEVLKLLSARARAPAHREHAGAPDGSAAGVRVQRSARSGARAPVARRDHPARPGRRLPGPPPSATDARVLGCRPAHPLRHSRSAEELRVARERARARRHPEAARRARRPAASRCLNAAVWGADAQAREGQLPHLLASTVLHEVPAERIEPHHEEAAPAHVEARVFAGEEAPPYRRAAHRDERELCERVDPPVPFVVDDVIVARASRVVLASP